MGESKGSADLHRNAGARFLDAVGLIDKHQFGLEACHLVRWQLAKRSNDDQIANSGLACRRTVDRDGAATSLGAYRVGDKTRTVVDVPDVYLLELGNARSLQQIVVNGTGALVVQFAMGDGGSVDFSGKKGALHGVSGRRGVGERVGLEKRGFLRPRTYTNVPKMWPIPALRC